MDQKLIEAAELIEENFCQKSYVKTVNGEDTYCLDGALQVVYGLPNGDRYTVISNFSAYNPTHVDYRRSVNRVVSIIPTYDCCELIVDKNHPPSIIHHYNDCHCDGGVQAAKILREAAEVEL